MTDSKYKNNMMLFKSFWGEKETGTTTESFSAMIPEYDAEKGGLTSIPVTFSVPARFFQHLRLLLNTGNQK